MDALNNKANALASLTEPVKPAFYKDLGVSGKPINYELISITATQNTTSNTTIAYNEIIKIYYKALVIAPNDTTVLTNKGIAFYKMKRYNEAIQIFNRGLKINQNDSGCLYNKGLVLELLGRQTEAGKYISIAQAKDPTYSGGLINKGPAIAADLASAIYGIFRLFLFCMSYNYL